LITISVDASKVHTSRQKSQIHDMADHVQRYKYEKGQFIKIEQGFCAAPTTSDGNCNWDVYYQEVMIFGSVGVILAGLLILFWVTFWIARRFCRCCGGMEASAPRMLCLVEKDLARFNGYTSFEIWAPKILIWLMFVAGFILLAIGWANNEFARGKITDFANQIYRQGVDVRDDLRSTNDTVTAAYYSLASSNLITQPLPNITKALDVAVVSADATVYQSNESRDYGVEFSIVRVAITHLTFFLCLIAFIMGTIAAVLNKPRLSLIASQIAMFGLVLVLVVLGVHYAFTIVSVDICDEMDKLVPVQTVPTNSSTLGSLLACDEPVRMDSYKKAWNLTEELRQSALFSGCALFQDNKNLLVGSTTAIEQACKVWSDGTPRPFTLQDGRNQANSSCTSLQDVPWQTCDPSSLTLQTVYPQILNLKVSSSSCGAPSGTSLRHCADSCEEGSTCALLSKNLVLLFDTVTNQLDPSIPVLANTSSCEFLLGFVRRTHVYACSDILQSVDAIWGVCLGLIFAVGISSTMMLIGYKRFDEENARAGFIPKYHFKRSSRVRPDLS